MGLFKRKKDEEIKIQLEKEALEKLNNNDVELFEIPNDFEIKNSIMSDWQIRGKTKAPHTITAEELNGNNKKANNITAKDRIAEEIPMSDSKESESQQADSPTTFLYQKMMQSRVKLTENTIEASKNEEVSNEVNDEIIEEIPSSKPSSPLDVDAAIKDLKNIANLNNDNKIDDFNTNDTTPLEDTSLPNNATTENTVAEENTIATDNAVAEENAIALENDVVDEDEEKNEDTAISESENSSIKKDDLATKEEIKSAKIDEFSDFGNNAEERRATLLARCNAFLEDDSGPIKANVEKYKLESVESILKDFETRAAERASKKFNTVIPTVFVSSDVSKSPINTISSTDSTNVAEDSTMVFEKISDQAKETAKAQPESTSKSNEVKHIFTANVSPKKDPTYFEDISSTRIITDISSKKSTTSNTTTTTSKTSVFPVVEPIIDTAVSSKESDLDITNSLHNDEEKSNIDDYTNISDRQKILNSLLQNKKSFIFKTLFSFIALVVSILTIASPISNKLQLSNGTKNIFDLLICLFIFIINLNVFSGIATFFGKKAKASLPAALSLIATTIFSAVNLILNETFVGLSSAAALTLLSYNLANKNFYSKSIKNFKLIADTEFKNAISIIQNKGATKTIVGNAIDGSALISYGGKTTDIHNFLRYTYCKNPIADKIQKLSTIGVIFGIILALVSLIFNSNNFVFALYILTTAICLTAMPSAYHIVSLTINSANKRLNHYDAMITGYRAADELELCNGIAISGDSLFPDGTIRLVDMKLLSPNPFDQSMLDAAAIATAIHSPLAGIFKQFDTSKVNATTNQEVDSVIYEEKMGISGWVNDRRVFVGNRDLMIAHGFAGLPPAELDKKIMRKGYFPVYVASDNILCALLIVKYEPDENIVYELQRLANTGTTILVDNCDPNINEKMLTDYFELYDDTIFVMSKQGSDYYKALIPHKEHRKAGAVFKSRIEGFFAALTASINIKKLISNMTVFYVLSVILGLLVLTTCILTSNISLVSPFNLLLLQFFFTVLTLLPPILRKP